MRHLACPLCHFLPFNLSYSCCPWGYPSPRTGVMVLFFAKDSQHHWSGPEPGLLGEWPRARPPWQPSTYSHHHQPAHPKETIPEPTAGLSSCSHSPPASWPWPFLFGGGQDSRPKSSSFLVFPFSSLEGSGPCPVHLGGSPSRAPLPTWTAGAPAAPVGSRSALSARPATVAASVRGCGPRPAGASRQRT